MITLDNILSILNYQNKQILVLSSSSLHAFPGHLRCFHCSVAINCNLLSILLGASDVEVIPSSTRAQVVYLDIVKSASVEMLWIFPTTSAFLRQDKMGGILLAMQAARERNVKVRIMMP
jgi:hypothetical protein